MGDGRAHDQSARLEIGMVIIIMMSPFIDLLSLRFCTKRRSPGFTKCARGWLWLASNTSDALT